MLEREREPSELERAKRESDRCLVMSFLEDRTRGFDALVGRLECVPRIVTARNERIGRPLGEEELADVVQNTLLIVWRKLPEFEGRSTLETWVYRISSLELMNAARRARRRRSRGIGDDEVLEAVLAAPRERRQHHYEDLYRALDRLEPEAREIVRLKHFGDLTFERIGERLGMTVDMTKTRYYRAIERLQRQLEPEEPER